VLFAAHRITRTQEVEEGTAGGAAVAVGEREAALGLDGERLAEERAGAVEAEAV